MMSRNISRLDIGHGHPKRTDGSAESAAGTHAAGSSPDAIASHAASAEISRHAAAEHIAAVAQRKPIARKVMAGIGVVAVAALGVWWVERAASLAAADAALESPETRAVTTRSGQRASLALDDGSSATLGAATTLRIIPEFGVLQRVVGLEGSADFTVVPSQHALWIRAGNLTVVVDSGAVAIAAYPGETALVSARSGSVRVRTPAGERQLTDGQAVVMAASGALRDATSSDLTEALAWIDGNVIIAGRRLQDALPILQRWFGTRVTVADSSLLAREVSASAPLGSSRLLIEGFEKSGGLKLEWKDKEMVLADGSQPPRTIR
jgi:transmembrane sensor